MAPLLLSTPIIADPMATLQILQLPIFSSSSHHNSQTRSQNVVASVISNSSHCKNRRRYSDRPLRLPPCRVSVASPPTPLPSAEEESSSGDVDETKEDENDNSSSSSKFSWRDHWYPVSLIEDLDPNRPTPFQLLGREIVLWKDRLTGDWVAFDDKCPHRLAPLSEGRIDEDGNLQCSYHGWSFDRCGSCTRIPQASTEGPEARAVKSPRSCATRLPTLVSQGLLFVWPDENGSEKASATKPPMLPDDFANPAFSTVTIQRDLFYGYDTLMENVSDPSHIDFAHHKFPDEGLENLQCLTHAEKFNCIFVYAGEQTGVSSDATITHNMNSVTGRRDRAKPLPFKLESSDVWGFAGANEGNPRISAQFFAPCYYVNKIEIDTKLPIFGDQKWIIWICSFNIPMAPGKTRSIVCSARNFFQFTMPGPAWWQMMLGSVLDSYIVNLVYVGDVPTANNALAQLHSWLVLLFPDTWVVPRWHEHWTSNKVYDGDMIVLQGQEKIFLSKSMEDSGDINKQYSKITFTPTQADRFVLAFRNWLRRHGNSQPEWFGITNQQLLPSAFLSKREMLDRFEQHTLKCSSCKGAYSAFQVSQKVLVGVAVLCCATAGIPSEIKLRIIIGVLALLSAGLAYALHELQKNFVFIDYVHSEID